MTFNADDFGFTRDVNAGIVYAHREGVLSSTTLMANGDAFDDAVRLSSQTPTLDVGCHLVLVQHGCSPLTGRPFPPTPGDLLLALVTRRIDPYLEFRVQIETLLQAGIRPSHLDTHKHTQTVPSVFRAMVRVAQEFNVPFIRRPLADHLTRVYRRAAAPYRLRMTDHFAGYRLTGSLDELSLSSALPHLRDGTTEFMCHPGFCAAELQGAHTRLKESRVRELEALTSPRIRALLTELAIRWGPFCAAEHRGTGVLPQSSPLL